MRFKPIFMIHLWSDANYIYSITIGPQTEMENFIELEDTTPYNQRIVFVDSQN